jgi:hypothetical protein
MAGNDADDVNALASAEEPGDSQSIRGAPDLFYLRMPPGVKLFSL